MMTDSIDELGQRAADIITGADALLIGAGAGMGVDSGLPDFRGRDGFWRAYPPYAKLGLDFSSIANPEWFETDPAFAWGFYGHRMNLYRAARPHEGFAILLRWAARMKRGAFVVTSNVDGQFQRAGFDPDHLIEVHGSIEWLQCMARCGVGLFPSASHDVHIDETTFRAGPFLPSCPRCGALARPNILMFGDLDWDGSRMAGQADRLDRWLESIAGARLAIVECGAGKAVPTIRRFCEQTEGTLIRLNPREPEVPLGRHLGIAAGALEALRAIDQVGIRKE